MKVCLEKKHLLSGEVHEYSCELIRFDGAFGILRYVIDRDYDVDGLHLHPGDVTFAFYWNDRPYTLYSMRTAGSTRPAYYFNIADRITLRPESFAWRDLAIDILVDSAGSVRILDEHDLPKDLDARLLAYIREATTHVLGNLVAIIEEAEFYLNEEACSSKCERFR